MESRSYVDVTSTFVPGPAGDAQAEGLPSRATFAEQAGVANTDVARGIQRPAAASAAWAVRQQTVLSEEPGVQLLSSQSAAMLTVQEAAAMQLNEAWPALQVAAGVSHQESQQQLLCQLSQQVEDDQQQQQQQQQLREQQEDQAAVSAHPSAADLGSDKACQAVHENDSREMQAGLTAAQQLGHLSESSCGTISQTGLPQCIGKDSSPDVFLQSRTQMVSPPSDAGVTNGTCLHQASTERTLSDFPQRPGQLLCDFYVRTGFCKFGQGCRFDHPVLLAVQLNSLGLPLRLQQPSCPFYAKTGTCKFGPSCKFHHPE